MEAIEEVTAEDILQEYDGIEAGKPQDEGEDLIKADGEEE